jgi:hypothetical protein
MGVTLTLELPQDLIIVRREKAHPMSMGATPYIATEPVGPFHLIDNPEDFISKALCGLAANWIWVSTEDTTPTVLAVPDDSISVLNYLVELEELTSIPACGSCRRVALGKPRIKKLYR